ncbi:MAG: hypothetical protein JXA36_01350 [Coriobacteriia bacterium]|nr:hypothetical protein [Coriobacteriia bacterium]
MSDPLEDKRARLLAALAEGLPVALRPFADLGTRIGVSESEALSALREMKEQRTICRVGALFSPGHLGYQASLEALALPEDRTEDVVAMLAALPNVTHVFEMDDRYRLWYTLVVPSRVRLEIAESEIAAAAGAADRYRVLPDERFKVTASFDADGIPEPPSDTAADHQAPRLDRDEKALVRLLQGDLPLVERPFSELGQTLGECGFDVDERWALERTSLLASSGGISRLAATRRTREEPWRVTLAVWRGIVDTEAAGRLIASFPEVIHCFERRIPGGMAVLSIIEGETRGDIDRAIDRIRIAGEFDAPRIAYPVREYFRSGMRYFTDGD